MSLQLFKFRSWRSVMLIGALLITVSILVANGASRGSNMPALRLTEQEREVATAKTQQMEITPGVGVGPLRFHMTPDQVEALLGKAEHRHTANKPPHTTTFMFYRKLGLWLTFDTDGAELRAVICMDEVQQKVQHDPIDAFKFGETMFGARSKPAVRFAGSTPAGIHVGSKWSEVIAAYGQPMSSSQYFPLRSDQPIEKGGDVIEHAYPGPLMVLERDGVVVEMHCVLPGWTNPPVAPDPPK